MAATAILGTGRVGLTLARALLDLGDPVQLLARTERTVPPPFPTLQTDWIAAVRGSEMVVIAVHDDGLPDAVAALAATRAIRNGLIVLHTSGLHDHTVLAPLALAGASTGSWHPLQSIPHPDSAAAFTGVPAILEGAPEAVRAARALSSRLGMTPIVELSPAAKVSYHAAAVFASNYLVVIAAIAERLARDAGLGDESAALFLPIMRQTLGNIAAVGPEAALTGPVRRGDVGTVAAHLAALEGTDRDTYLALAREAVRLAESAGLPGDRVAALRGELQ